MKSLTNLLTLVILMAGSVFCSNSKFRGSQSEKKSDDSSQIPVPEDECDTSGEQIKLSFPHEDIQKCIDDGNIYHFGLDGLSGRCTDVKASFSCSFDNIKEAVGKIGIDPKIIEDARSKNAKLLNCGEKNSGRTIVAQWVYLKGDLKECEYSQATVSNVVTSCYKRYDGGAPPIPETREEKYAAVAACMDEAN